MHTVCNLKLRDSKREGITGKVKTIFDKCPSTCILFLPCIASLFYTYSTFPYTLTFSILVFNCHSLGLYTIFELKPGNLLTLSGFSSVLSEREGKIRMATVGRNIAALLLFLNLVMYFIVLGFASWRINKYINGQTAHPSKLFPILSLKP